MRKLPLVITLFACFQVVGPWILAQTYDLEYIYLQEFSGQKHSTLSINLIANLATYDISEIKSIIIEADNEVEGDIRHISLTIDPGYGFQVNDVATASIVDDYLHHNLSYDQVSEKIRIYRDEPELFIHPKIFVFNNLKQIKIQMLDYPAQETALKYDVSVEMESGMTPKIGTELITMKFIRINFECLKYISLLF